MRSKSILKVVGAAFALCAAGGGVALGVVIWSVRTDVAKNCALAQHICPHAGDDVAALVDVMNSADRDLHQRNLAVWSLGQLANSRALTALEANYTGKLCDHNAGLCQYELEKAVKRCGGHPAPRQTRAHNQLGI